MGNIEKYIKGGPLEGYMPCKCHPETCCHSDGLVYIEKNKPKKKIRNVKLR